MMYGIGGWNPWMLALMTIGILLFWGFVIWGGLQLFRGSRLVNHGSGRLRSGQILNERLARGEISTEEFERQQKLIDSTA